MVLKHPKACDNPINVVQQHVTNGSLRRRQFGCGKLTCESCASAWRKRVMSAIMDGVKAHDGADYRFVTLTFRGPQYIEKVMSCWRSLMKVQIPTKWRYYRVLEHKGQNPHTLLVTNPHFHLVTDCKIPLTKTAYSRKHPGPQGQTTESVKAWTARQSLPAQMFSRMLESLGFGPIYDCQVAHRKGYGAPSYMAKYLSKAEYKVLIRPHGRRVRMVGSSRNWRPPLDYTRPYECGEQHFTSAIRADEVPEEFEEEGLPNQPASVKDARRRARVQAVYDALTEIDGRELAEWLDTAEWIRSLNGQIQSAFEREEPEYSVLLREIRDEASSYRRTLLTTIRSRCYGISVPVRLIDAYCGVQKE